MKILLKSLAVIVLLLVLAVAALLFLVDPNRFKPRIEDLAKDRGIALQINGDLGWNFWPGLGVAVHQVSVAPLDYPEQPIAELAEAGLLLKLLPLLGGNFQVDHIAIDGLRLRLARDASGVANWEAFSRSGNKAAPTPAQNPGEQTELTLDIQEFSVSNARVDYLDQQTGQSIQVRDIDLKTEGVNTHSSPFTIAGDFVLEQAQTGSAPLSVSGDFSAKASIDQALDNLGLREGNLKLALDAQDQAELTAEFSITVKSLQANPSYQGQVMLKETNARRWLAAMGTEITTANADALSQVGLSGNVAGDAEQVKLDNLQLRLDDTAFKGSAAITQFEKPTITLSLTGESLNLDDYLPPPADPLPGAPTAAAEDTPLPVEALRALNLNIKLMLGELVLKNMALKDVTASVLAKNGMIQQSLNGSAYSGTLASKNQLDVRGNVAQLQFDLGMDGLELEPLLKDLSLESKMGLQGAVQARAMGTSQGLTTTALLSAVNANANFSGAQVRVSPINLEQQFCKLVNMVTQTQAADQDWEEFTELTALEGSIKWRNQVITIDTFTAGVEKLQLDSTGKIDLANDHYDIFLPFKLHQDSTDTVSGEQVSVATSSNGCRVGSHYWLERGLALLRCKGSLDQVNPVADCRPDKDMLVELTKDYAVYKVKEKHGAKIEEKKDELKQKVEDKKHQLFDKLQQRLNRGAASSAAPAENQAPVGENAASSTP